MVSPESFFRLDHKVAAVTGGGQGIGEAICRRFADAGARVAVFDRDAARARASPIPWRGSLSPAMLFGSHIARALAAIQEKLGDVDILVNNAESPARQGRFGNSPNPTWRMSWR